MNEERIFYDREGNPISLREHAKRVRDKNYIKVRQNVVRSANDIHVLVSTIWLGIDFSSGFSGEPLIFHTKSFYLDQDGRPVKPMSVDNGLPFDYYSNEFDAWSGHDFICDWISNNDIDEQE